MEKRSLNSTIIIIIRFSYKLYDSMPNKNTKLGEVFDGFIKKV